jgi:hypothetical protein
MKKNVAIPQHVRRPCLIGRCMVFYDSCYSILQKTTCTCPSSRSYRDRSGQVHLLCSRRPYPFLSLTASPTRHRSSPPIHPPRKLGEAPFPFDHLVRRVPGMDASLPTPPSHQRRPTSGVDPVLHTISSFFLPSRFVLVFFRLNFFCPKWMNPFYTFPIPLIFRIRTLN